MTCRSQGWFCREKEVLQQKLSARGASLTLMCSLEAVAQPWANCTTEIPQKS